MRFRLDIYGEDGPTFIDGGRQKRDTITGVVSFAASPGTVISADIMHQDYDLEGQQITFTPYVNKQGQTIVPAAFNPGKQYGQSWTYTRSEKDLVGVSITSQLTDVFTLRGAYRYGGMWRDYAQITGAFNATPGAYSERYSRARPK